MAPARPVPASAAAVTATALPRPLRLTPRRLRLGASDAAPRWVAVAMTRTFARSCEAWARSWVVVARTCDRRVWAGPDADWSRVLARCDTEGLPSGCGWHGPPIVRIAARKSRRVVAPGWPTPLHNSSVHVQISYVLAGK